MSNKMNDNQIVQKAAESFQKVPEFYQELCGRIGVEFPNELVDAINEKPEKAIEILQNDEKLLQLIVAIYNDNDKEINKKVEYKDMEARGKSVQSAMFEKNGGKLAYGLEKFAKGGISKKQARKAYKAKDERLTDDNFNTAYANAKYALKKNSGLKGRELKQAARKMVAGIQEPNTPEIKNSAAKVPTSISNPKARVASTDELDYTFTKNDRINLNAMLDQASRDSINYANEAIRMSNEGAKWGMSGEQYRGFLADQAKAQNIINKSNLAPIPEEEIVLNEPEVFWNDYGVGVYPVYNWADYRNGKNILALTDKLADEDVSAAVKELQIRKKHDRKIVNRGSYYAYTTPTGGGSRPTYKFVDRAYGTPTPSSEQDFFDIMESPYYIYKTGGRLVRKGYTGMQTEEPENVQRGTEPAYSISTRPKSASDEYLGYTTVWDNGDISHARNYFSGNTLRQDLIRSGWKGTPRRVSRVIYNYGMPQADTVYVDANGNEGRRKQTAWQRFWDIPVTHSKQFMDGIDAALTKMVPAEINEKEVKARK